MDPNACLHRLIEAADSGDVTAALSCVDDLKGWLESDGFHPTPELYGSAIESLGFLLAEQVVQ